MATINLGSIKFNWRGSYSGATSYVIDDVVESGGNSYVCILASTGNTPPNATYWELMAQAGTNGTNGTNGTDLTTTLTTQGDLVYRDGSGLQRLGAGTAGQVLQTGGAGANPSWTNLSSDYVKLADGQVSSNVAQVSIDGFFSSTYKNYVLLVDNILLNTGGTNIFCQYNFSGSPSSLTQYAYARNINASTSANSASTYYGAEWTSSRIVLTSDVSNANPYVSSIQIQIFDPLNTTSWKHIHFQSCNIYGNGGGIETNIGAGFYRNVTSAISGITLLPGANNLAQLNYNLYGIKGV